ncbi:MAG: ArsR family transcriptional regulator, partial [Candidatus Dormibacteraceae bacterium]
MNGGSMDNAGSVAISSQPGATKLRILALLRRRPRTIPELAAELSLTGNAVRTHLATLERDRLVAPHGHRLTVRRPATIFALTPAADQFLT